MKNYLLIIIALLCNLQLFAQSIEWEQYYGGSDFDAIQAFAQTNDGGYIFGGVSSSIDGDVSSNYGNGDIWLVKTDELGIIQWEKNYGGSEIENLGSIKQTSDSGYIIGGHTYSNDNDVGENYGSGDAWFAKLDIDGNIEWEKNFGGTEYDELRAIEIANNGDYILGGSTRSNDGDVGGNYGEPDFWVVRIDPVGNIIWEKNYGGTDSDNLYALNKTNDGGYILGGTTRSNDGDVGENFGENDYWIIKINAGGEIEWEKSFGGSGQDILSHIEQTNDNGYIINGSSYSSDGDVTTNYGSSDYWIIKIDDLGNLEWEKSFGGSDGDSASHIEQTNDSGYFISGHSNSFHSDTIPFREEFWVIKTDSIGNVEWDKTYGNDRDHYLLEGQQTPDGGYILGSTIIKASPPGDFDLWVVKIASDSEDNCNDLSISVGQGCSSPCGCDRLLVIETTGGDGNYTFTDDNGQAIFNGMDYDDFTGSYITVTDGNGCTASGSPSFFGACCDAICYVYNSLLVTCELNGIATLEVILDEGSLFCDYDIVDQNGNQYQNGDTIPDGFYIFEFYDLYCRLQGTTQVAVDCFSSCDCPDVSDPVCGTDGNTYDNPCLAECAGVVVASLGSCSTDCNCSQEYIPVCGSNGITYSNACFAECDGITDYEPGSCSSLCDLGNLFTYEYVESIGTDDVPQSYVADIYCFQENLGIDNICGWNWDFGNGTTSTEADPCGIIFASIESGEPVTEPYLVCLTVSDCNGVELGTCCENIYPSTPPVNPCADLADIDFGSCEALLGAAVVNGSCQFISGCGTTVNDIDYSPYFFPNLEVCIESCIDDETPNFPDFPWLDDIVDVENCCGNTTVTEYSTAGYSFIYIKMGDGCDGLTQLYLNDGTFYCTSSNNFDCYEAYNLNLLTETVLFACGNVTECNCPEIYDPVCATDGITYDNECLAECAGATIDYLGACTTDYPSDTTLACLLPNQVGIYCPTILDGYSITYYSAAFPNCTIELIDDCLEYHGFPGEYLDYLEVLICNADNDCYQVVYQITINNECIIETYNCEMQEECTEALTPIVLCPEFCAFNDQNYSIQSINSFYTACSIRILDDLCFRYIPLPQMENYNVADSISVIACNPAGLCDTILYLMNVGNCPNEEKLDQTEAFLNTEFEVYPNPNNGLFYINLITESLEDQTVSIYDLTGKIIETYTISAESRINNIQVDMNDVSSGMYFVEWRTATQHSTERIIIE